MYRFMFLLFVISSTAVAQFPATLDLTQLNGSDGFELSGADIRGWTGWSAKSAGDLNGDGLDELIVGADGAGPNESGEVYVLWGSDAGFPQTLVTDELSEDIGFKIFTSDPRAASLGWSVDGVGDVNNDGIDDIVVGDQDFDVGGVSGVGAFHVIFGGMSDVSGGIDLVLLDGSNGFTFLGDSAFISGALGNSVSAAGDINNDGLMDIAVGAPRTDSNGVNAGLVYVIYGRDSGFPATIQASELNEDIGFRITGAFSNMWLGWMVRPLGDVNGDGIDDLGISARNSFSDAAGLAFVLYGNEKGFPVNLLAADIGGANGFKVHAEFDERKRTILMGAGDFNGDGKADIAVSSMLPGEFISPSSGIPYVIYGRDKDFPADLFLSELGPSEVFRIFNPEPEDFRLGQSLGSAGDINADGFDDLYLGTFTDTDFILGYVIFGRNDFMKSPVFDLAMLNGQNGFRIKGNPYESTFVTRTPIAALNDFNGDGVNDFAVGNQFAQNSQGQIVGATHVVFGKGDLIFKSDFE